MDLKLIYKIGKCYLFSIVGVICAMLIIWQINIYTDYSYFSYLPVGNFWLFDVFAVLMLATDNVAIILGIDFFGKGKIIGNKFLILETLCFMLLVPLIPYIFMLAWR